jgi:hypothetical protein
MTTPAWSTSGISDTKDSLRLLKLRRKRKLKEVCFTVFDEMQQNSEEDR